MATSAPLPLDIFPAWARLNDVVVTGVELQHGDSKGIGLVAAKDFYGEEDGSATVMRIPRDIVLSAETVEEYAKVDQHFRQLLETAGRESTRKDIMLYLLCQLVHGQNGQPSSKGITHTPWTEYIRFLPRPIPVPTMWSDCERLLLVGTSLEAALEAKMSALANEFDDLRERTKAMPFWNALLWEHDTASLDEWVLADAWYRSRCLELPQMGDAMVPGLDMINHSSDPNAYYDVDSNYDPVLIMRTGCAAPRGCEVTISYGEAKSAGEMLFSYGFIDKDGAGREMTLHLDPLPDDPLGKAKLYVFGSRPTVRLCQNDAPNLQWHSKFVYLMCLNEEDGLEFRLQQDTTGGCQLRLFWQGDDVTEQAGEFESLIQGHDMCEVFRLRAVAVLRERVEAQLSRIQSGPRDEQLRALATAGLLREECISAAMALQEMETHILKAAAQELEDQKSKLLAHDSVVSFIESMEDVENEEDFS